MTQKTSWGKVANWYDKLLEDNSDTYQKQVILPNLLRLLSPKKEQNILDLCCGQGFFCREIIKIGAKVVGIDISKELIELAKTKASVNEEYFVKNADNLSGLMDNKFDLGICVLAIQNVFNFQKSIQEIHRVLKNNGRFIFVLNHPCFRILQKSSWEYDEHKQVQYRRLEGYLSEYMVNINMNPGQKFKRTAFTKSFHRPLQSYFKAFFKVGFRVSRLEEWVSHKTSDSGKRKQTEDRARKEFPLFLAIELIK